MRTLFVLATLLMLSACSLPVFFRVPVVQGNVVTAKNVGQLELGMTKRQVQYVMGTSLIDSSFEKDRWDYVFYYRDPRAHVRQSELNLYFANGQLAQIEGDDEYTASVMDGAPGLDDDNPLPSEVSPGPDNDGPGPYDDELGPYDDGPGARESTIGAPLPGT
ncbi:outer membrane protein assembly factor BamE [Salinisphaera sp. T31B1]|uniref:outer membrane protein assembly factor BamE n=1 Tax=Salinisphaera sp. T31B1 TaxID=727963 RepID=UPI003340F49C